MIPLFMKGMMDAGKIVAKGVADKIPNFKSPDIPTPLEKPLPDSGKIPDFTEKIPTKEQGRSYDYLPRNGGRWDGEPGDSTWRPDRDDIPKKNNPEGKTWGEILDEYGIDGIPFKDGYPDFSKIAEETVEIGDFSENRNENFNQADKKLAEKWNEEGKDGRTDWKASEVSEYRKENNLTWHECEDKKTLQLVPSEVHNNVPHRGGISVMKQESSEG